MSAIALLGVLAAATAAAPQQGWQQRLDALIEQGRVDEHVPGLAVGIVLDGKLAYAKGFGSGKLGDPAAPMTPTTLVHMASVTKPFVATALMQLVEQGRIKLDAPVVDYLPSFALADPRARRITVRQMVTHTSGMPDVKDYRWDHPERDDGALDRYVRSLSGERLLAEPGARYAYSNMAFEVLGDLIAKVSGASFEGYLQAHLLKPLGMRSSTLLLEAADPSRLAAGYTTAPGSSEPKPIAAYPYNRAHGPSSGLISDVEDMARWAMANLNRGTLDGVRILESKSYDTLWKPAAEVEFRRPDGETRKPGLHVGLSWFLEEKNGHLVVSHGGGDDGFITALMLIPDRHFAFVLLSNSDSGGIPLLKRIRDQALELGLGDPAR